MTINIRGLRKAGVAVNATVGGERYRLPDDTVIELHFENGKFPQVLHDAVHEMLPNQEIEANVITEHMAGKINAFLLAKVIDDTAETK